MLAALGLWLSMPQGAFATATLANPDWDITVSEFGYSDLLIYNAGPFPAGFLHEMLSGEWVAAIGYEGLGVAEAAMWLEPDLLDPTWTTNSGFEVVTALTDLSDPDADGLPEWYSVIKNGVVEIHIFFDMEDTMTGTPMGLRDGAFVLSNRYVLRQTYRVTNKTNSPLQGLRFYQMLHGHPANTEADKVEEVYDPDVHAAGALPTFRYDITQYATNSGAPTGHWTPFNFADHVGMHSEVLPNAWGLGHYRNSGPGKPVDNDVDGDGDGDGIHFEIERDSLEKETHFGPDEVGGAMRHDLTALDPGKSVAFEFMLTVRSEFDEPAFDQTEGPTFSIDFQGPSITLPDSFAGLPIDQGTILTTSPPGPAGPNPALPGPLPSPGYMVPGVLLPPTPFGAMAGEVDAFSYGRDHGARLLFSVDEFAVGVATAGIAPDVASEGSSGAEEASADIFAYLGPVAFTPPGPGAGNVQFYDGSGTLPDGTPSTPGFGLIEPNPAASGLPDHGDNLDAFDNDTTLADVLGMLYFSLDAGFVDPLEGTPVNSGSATPFGVSPADVLVLPPGGIPVTVIDASVLGLDLEGPGTDDLDALIFHDADDSVSLTNGDVILFSVRRGSAVIGELDSMLGIPIVEGDILSPPDEEGDPPAIFVPAEALGLATARGSQESGGDELDALDLPEPGSSLGLVVGGALLSWLRRRRGRC